MSTEKEFQEHLDEYNHEVFSESNEKQQEDFTTQLIADNNFPETQGEKDYFALIYLITPVIILVSAYYVIGSFF